MNWEAYAVQFNEQEVESFLEATPSRHEVCVVVPAYNEEQVIDASLTAMAEIIGKEHIFVVSDGSSDRTAELARLHTDNVLELPENMGKAKALDQLIRAFNLVARYEYILFSDADSRLAPNFLEEVKKYVASDAACIVGTVASDRRGLVSAYRTYEYGMSHRVYKRAQSTMQVITVAPGSSSLYRSDVLRELDFTNHTLTEDFDLTLQIHRYGLGRVVYAPGAKVITQDPPTIKDYWKQVMRWYTGFWQNVFMHRIYLPNSTVNLEIWFLVLDSMSWVAGLILGLYNPHLLLSMLGVMIVMTEAMSLVILLMERAYWAIPYMPFFIIFHVMNLMSYGLSFFRAIFNQSKRLSWQKVSRYSV